VTENDASKAKTSRIKLFVGVIAVAIAITTAIASALVNRPQRDDVVILTPPADSSQADKVDNSGSEKVISKTTISRIIASIISFAEAPRSSEAVSPKPQSILLKMFFET